VDPTGSLEVWRNDLVHFAYRVIMADNPAHSVQTGD
jgi:hypothetical protein